MKTFVLCIMLLCMQAAHAQVYGSITYQSPRGHIQLRADTPRAYYGPRHHYREDRVPRHWYRNYPQNRTYIECDNYPVFDYYGNVIRYIRTCDRVRR